MGPVSHFLHERNCPFPKGVLGSFAEYELALSVGTEFWALYSVPLVCAYFYANPTVF